MLMGVSKGMWPAETGPDDLLTYFLPSVPIVSNCFLAYQEKRLSKRFFRAVERNSHKEMIHAANALSRISARIYNVGLVQRIELLVLLCLLPGLLLRVFTSSVIMLGQWHHWVVWKQSQDRIDALCLLA